MQIWHVEVRIFRSISESPLDSEITRVDCTFWNFYAQGKGDERDNERTEEQRSEQKQYAPQLFQR